MTTPEYDFFVPERIAHWINRLEEDTGVRPTLRRYVTGYLMEHENEHVRMTSHFKQRKGGRWLQASSTLTIDGVRQKLLANDWADYVATFKRGRRLGLGDMPVVELPDLDWTLDEEELPRIVVKESDVLMTAVRKANPKAQVVVTYAKDGDDYVTRMDAVGIYAIARYVRCQTPGHGHYLLDGNGVRLIDRESMKDLTDLFSGSGSQIAEILAGLRDNGDPGKPDSLGAPVESSRSNSVEVRRATVIRN